MRITRPRFWPVAALAPLPVTSVAAAVSPRREIRRAW